MGYLRCGETVVAHRGNYGLDSIAGNPHWRRNDPNLGEPTLNRDFASRLLRAVCGTSPTKNCAFIGMPRPSGHTSILAHVGLIVHRQAIGKNRHPTAGTGGESDSGTGTQRVGQAPCGCLAGTNRRQIDARRHMRQRRTWALPPVASSPTRVRPVGWGRCARSTPHDGWRTLRRRTGPRRPSTCERLARRPGQRGIVHAAADVRVRLE